MTSINNRLNTKGFVLVDIAREEVDENGIDQLAMKINAASIRIKEGHYTDLAVIDAELAFEEDTIYQNMIPNEPATLIYAQFKNDPETSQAKVPRPWINAGTIESKDGRTFTFNY